MVLKIEKIIKLIIALQAWAREEIITTGTLASLSWTTLSTPLAHHKLKKQTQKMVNGTQIFARKKHSKTKRSPLKGKVGPKIALEYSNS